MRRTRSKIAQLKRHLDRVRWRDKQAAQTYYTLLLAQKPRGPTANLTALDVLLKEYYTAESIGSEVESSFLNFFRAPAKKHNGSDTYTYVVARNIMPRIVDDDPPIKTHPATQAYRDNWDRVFGTEHVVDCIVPDCPGCDDGSPERAERYACSTCCDTGAVVDTARDPSTIETEGDMLTYCPACSTCPCDVCTRDEP